MQDSLSTNECVTTIVDEETLYYILRIHNSFPVAMIDGVKGGRHNAWTF